MKIRRLTRLALLTSLALILFVIELRIPNLMPIPGMKLGIANIITVYAVYQFQAWETAMMVIARILLGAMFSGNVSALLYSAAGAVLCLCGMLLIRRVISLQYIWLSSILGAVLHNTGQILAAVLVMKTVSVFVYYPILLVSGCLAGFMTGMCARMILRRNI